MINEKLHELYMQYYGNDYDKKIIPCGVVDEDVYSTLRPRIVFILKEPHTSRTGWTIPGGLKRNADRGDSGFEKGYAYTWNQAGVWAYAIHHGFKSYQELCSPLLIAEGVRAIGMTNLKKTGGGAAAFTKRIKNCARSDASLWRQELELMDPELIICGRTYSHVVSNLMLKSEKLLEDKGKPYYCAWWEINGHEAVILQFWHPACRKNRTELLELLQRLIQRMKEGGMTWE